MVSEDGLSRNSDGQVTGGWIEDLMKLKDPMENMFKINKHQTKCTILLGGYAYPVDLKTIKSVDNLLSWVYHLSGKSWMTGAGIRYFMNLVVKIKNIHIKY